MRRPDDLVRPGDDADDVPLAAAVRHRMEYRTAARGGDMNNVSLTAAMRDDTVDRAAAHRDVMRDNPLATAAAKDPDMRVRHRDLLTDNRPAFDETGDRARRDRDRGGRAMRVERAALRFGGGSEKWPGLVAKIVRDRSRDSEVFRAVAGVGGVRRSRDEGDGNAEPQGDLPGP